MTQLKQRLQPEDVPYWPWVDIGPQGYEPIMAYEVYYHLYLPLFERLQTALDENFELKKAINNWNSKPTST